MCTGVASISQMRKLSQRSATKAKSSLLGDRPLFSAAGRWDYGREWRRGNFQFVILFVFRASIGRSGAVLHFWFSATHSPIIGRYPMVMKIFCLGGDAGGKVSSLGVGVPECSGCEVPRGPMMPPGRAGQETQVPQSSDCGPEEIPEVWTGLAETCHQVSGCLH